MCAAFLGSLFADDDLEQVSDAKASVANVEHVPAPEPAPEPEPEPEPAPKSKWLAQPYTLVEDKNISSSIRTRRRLRIVAPAASTPESQIATLMQAVIELIGKPILSTLLHFSCPSRKLPERWR